MAKKKSSKTQIQIGIIGALVAVIIGVIIFFASKGEKLVIDEYIPKKVNIDFSTEVFDNPEFETLAPLVKLPITPGQKGRSNPFEEF